MLHELLIIKGLISNGKEKKRTIIVDLLNTVLAVFVYKVNLHASPEQSRLLFELSGASGYWRCHEVGETKGDAY